MAGALRSESPRFVPRYAEREAAGPCTVIAPNRPRNELAAASPGLQSRARTWNATARMKYTVSMKVVSRASAGNPSYRIGERES